MYKCVGMNKKELKILEELNSDRGLFNEQNSDFFPEYKVISYPMQLLLLRKIKLLKRNFDYVGYSWFTTQNRNRIRLNSLFVNADKDQLEGFNALITPLKKKPYINYFCTRNSYNFEILQELGFEKKNGNFEMLRQNLYFNSLDLDKDISFQLFKKAEDEELRCFIQNEIFKNSNRIPLTVADIYFDQLQNYYLPKGSIFIKYKNQYIGYGQIIIDEGKPTIVNFGILPNYRNKGFGKIFLDYLLNLVKEEGYASTSIKVRADNEVALKLYSSHDFKKVKETYNFELSRR